MNDRLPVSTPASAPETAPDECVEGNDLLQQYAELHIQTVGRLADFMARMHSGSECFKAVEIQQDATYLAGLRRAVAECTDPSDPIRTHLRRLSPDDFMQHRCSLKTYQSMLEDAVGEKYALSRLVVAVHYESGKTAEEKIASFEHKLQTAGARIIHGMPTATENWVVWWPFHLPHHPDQWDIRLSIADQMKAAVAAIENGTFRLTPEVERMKVVLAEKISQA